MAFHLSEPAEAAGTLFMAPAWFGIVSLIIFAVLLGVTFAFKNIGNRH